MELSQGTGLVKIKVLVVEASERARSLQLRLLALAPEIEVLGTARDGAEALDFLKRLKPDVVTMALHLPRLDGIETTRLIMESCPLPIVIVDGNDPSDIPIGLAAVKAGAVAVVALPSGLSPPDDEAAGQHFLQTIRLMSEVKVVRRRSRTAADAPPASSDPVPVVGPGVADVRIIAIGASAGGPPVLQSILAGLAPELPVPILVVQHIDAAFVPGFASWLGATSNLPVRIAAAGERARPGHVYLPPGDHHLGVSSGGSLDVNQNAPVNGHRPAVSYLFRSVSGIFGAHAVGVLLSGMGADGAIELRTMKDRGAVTIAQDEESSLVFGMPGEAIRLGAASHVLSPEKIVRFITRLTALRVGSGP